MTHLPEQDRYEAAIEDNQQALQLCIKMGAGKAKVTPPPQPPHSPPLPSHPLPNPRGAIVSHLRRAQRRASRVAQLLDVHYQIGLGYFRPLVSMHNCNILFQFVVTCRQVPSLQPGTGNTCSRASAPSNS